MMPRMNGYQLCQHIKEDINISHIPIILLTARDDEQSQKEGYKQGADAYLAKPFEEDTLIELIRNRLKDREQTRKRYMQAGSVPVPEEVTYSAADEAFLAKLNQVINNNLDNCNLDIATLCKEVHMSRASLYNKLKALTNISANEYINKFRMEKAIQLIVHTDMPFTEIAEKQALPPRLISAPLSSSIPVKRLHNTKTYKAGKCSHTIAKLHPINNQSFQKHIYQNKRSTTHRHGDKDIHVRPVILTCGLCLYANLNTEGTLLSLNKIQKSVFVHYTFQLHVESQCTVTWHRILTTSTVTTKPRDIDHPTLAHIHVSQYGCPARYNSRNRELFR